MAATHPTSGNATVVGVFHDRKDAREAVEDLKRAGFRDDQIGFASREAESTGGAVAAGEITTDTGPGSGAATGAVTGGLLGGLLGAAAALLIPGVGPVVAGGILASALGGAALGAAGGGILGALVTTGVPEEDARYYDQEFQAGRTVVTVAAGNRAAEAQAILTRHRASFAQGGQRSAMASPMNATTERTATAESGLRVPEVEERLNVQKRERQEGEVKVHTSVIEEQKTVPVSLTHEEVRVERRDTADRPLKPGETAFQEGTIRVPLRGEEVVVSKEAVVTGEVVINKERQTEQQQVSDTVRRTEVHVDQDRQNVSMPGGDIQYRQYVQEMRSDARYRDRRFEEIESDLQKDWVQRHPSTPWETAKAYIREAWMDVKSAGR